MTSLPFGSEVYFLWVNALICKNVIETALTFPFNSDSLRNILAKNIVAHIFASDIIQTHTKYSLGCVLNDIFLDFVVATRHNRFTGNH